MKIRNAEPRLGRGRGLSSQEAAGYPLGASKRFSIPHVKKQSPPPSPTASNPLPAFLLLVRNAHLSAPASTKQQNTQSLLIFCFTPDPGRHSSPLGVGIRCRSASAFVAGRVGIRRRSRRNSLPVGVGIRCRLGSAFPTGCVGISYRPPPAASSSYFLFIYFIASLTWRKGKGRCNDSHLSTKRQWRRRRRRQRQRQPNVQ